MTDTLLLMITAHQKSKFFFSAKEIEDYAESRGQKAELRSRELLRASLQRLLRAELPRRTVLLRLAEIFGVNEPRR